MLLSPADDICEEHTSAKEQQLPTYQVDIPLSTKRISGQSCLLTTRLDPYLAVDVPGGFALIANTTSTSHKPANLSIALRPWAVLRRYNDITYARSIHD